MYTKKSIVLNCNLLTIYSGTQKRSQNKSSLPSTLPYTIDYKNVYLLRRYLGITGKILPRHITKLTAKEHREMAKAIRRARRIGLLPFVWLTNLIEKNFCKHAKFQHAL